MTDVQKQKTREQLAAERLTEVVRKNMDRQTAVELIEGAYVQTHLSLAAIKGLTRLLLHKGILTEIELSGSLAWAYEERTSQLMADEPPRVITPILAKQTN